MSIANVTLNNTFDEWRTTTNQLITFVNEVNSQQLINAASNTAALTITPNKISRNQTFYITLNVSSDVLDTSTLNVATANAVNIVFAGLANTEAKLISITDNANTINAVANAAIIQANVARSHANAAHAAANAGLTQANTARNHANVAFEQANTARIHANTAHVAANAGLTQANTAFDRANSAYDLAVSLSGNTIPILEANKAAFDNSNSAFLQANTARVHANTAHASANAGLLQANTARDHANAAFLAANNVAPQIAPTFVQANTARDHANTAHASANAGLIQANTARIHANTAHATANAGFDQANTARVHANTAHASANAGLLQANTARDHANAAFLAANNVAPQIAPTFVQANTARDHANTAHASANAGLLQANTARDHANAAFNKANTAVTDFSPAFIQANTARDHANTAHASANAGLLQANTARDHANAAFGRANTGFSNTSGSSFVGNMQIPTGNLTIGDGTTQGVRLHVNSWIGVANVWPQAEIMGGSQFIQFNANTNFGGWNDLMLARDISIIYSRGGSDDSANLVIGPWTDSSFGYKQDGAGRHGFNTSNPRHTLDANGTANISSTLTVGANIIVRGTSITINGLEVIQNTANQTITNKRVTSRVASTSSNSATPTLNTDNTDHFIITGQTVNITSMTSGLSGTPTDGQKLIVSMTAGSGTPTVSWGTSFESSGSVTLPSSISTTRLDIGFLWNAATSKWRCVAAI